VSLHVTNRKGLIQHLDDNDVDLVIMGQPPEEMCDELHAKSFMQNPLVMIAAPTHPFAIRKNIPLKELQNQIFLIRERGSGTRNAMERHFKERELILSTGMEMSTDEAIKQGVQAELGLGIVSWHSIQMELEMQKLSILSVKSFPIIRHWFIVRREGKCLSPIAQAFWEFILKQSEQLTS
jgi:DNA-binding transcriptional LysR family regulator